MKFWITALSANRAELVIFGEIGDPGAGPFEQGGTTPAQVKRDLDRMGDVAEIVVKINSPGGNFFDGLAIFNLLKSHPARIRVEVEGLAASVASVIAMAGDVVIMRRDSYLMIHRASMAAAGHGEDLREAGALLDRIDQQMVDIYSRRAKVSRKHLVELLAAETWLIAHDAVRLGFADEVSEDAAAAAHFDLSNFSRVPKMVKAKLEGLNDDQDGRQPPVTADPAAKAILAADKRRRTAIRARFGQHAETHRQLLDECLDDPDVTPDMAAGRLIDALARTSPRICGINPNVVSGGTPAPGTADFISAASDALLIRAGVRLREPHPAARDVAELSLADLARACLEHSPRAGFWRRRERDPIRAALTTSDFPAILEDAVNKQLRRGFESEPGSHRQWIRVQPVSDFRPQKRPILGSGPDLEHVAERGEYKHGAFEEDGTEYSVRKFGRIIDLSWETLKNDNLGVFLTRIPPAMGQAARRLEADAVYGLFELNGGNGPEMQDGVALFDGAHKNVAEAQPALDKDALGAGRLLLRKQTAVGGGLLSLVPRYLIVPAELETDAEILIAAATQHRSAIDSNDTAGTVSTLRSTTGVTPEWIARLELVVEPRLGEGAFYLATTADQVDTVELGVLDENEGGPVIQQEETFSIDALQWKVRHVFEPKFLDWRGIVQVPLAAD